MKAMELVIFPPIPPDPYESGEFLHNQPEVLDWENARFNEDVSKYRKRLTDAELAAEFWKAKERCMFVSAFSGMSVSPDSHSARQALALHRFATLPHHDEDQP